MSYYHSREDRLHPTHYNGQSDEESNNPDSQLAILQSKQRSSILWLLSKAFEESIPDDLKDPFYKDHSGEERIKAYIVQSLASAELYGKALSNIYQDPNYNTLSHSQVIHVLMRKGIYVQNPEDASLTESVLLQTAPIKMSAHMVMIEAVMSLYIKEVLIPEKVIDVVGRFCVIDPEEELPEEAEDAALFWINKSCQKLTERIEEEVENRVLQRRDRKPDPEDEVPNIPMLEYLWDLSDGCSLASLLSFYCPEELNWKEITYNEPMSPADCNYNLQLVEIFCQERLPCDIFFLDVDDLYRCHPVIRPNILALVADLLFHLEIRPAPCVRTPVPDLFNQLFMTSDEEERFAREEQLSSINGRFSNASREQLFRLHGNTWESDEHSDKRRRRKSSLSKTSPGRQGYGRTLLQGNEQEYEAGEETVDSDDLTQYMTALDIQPDSPSDMSNKDGISGPQSLSFSVNKNGRRRSNSSLQHQMLQQQLSTQKATYIRGTSPGKRISGNPRTPGAEYLTNAPAESSSSGDDQTNYRLRRGVNSSRGSIPNGTPPGRGEFMSQNRFLNRSKNDSIFSPRDPYHRSIHNLPTDALAAASASVTDIPRAGVLSRCNSTSTTPQEVMHNQHHLLSQGDPTFSPNSTSFLQNNGKKQQTPNKEAMMTSLMNSSPLTPNSNVNISSNSNNGMYVTTGSSSSHTTSQHLDYYSRSGSTAEPVIHHNNIVGRNHEPLSLVFSSPQGLRLSRQDSLTLQPHGAHLQFQHHPNNGNPSQHWSPNDSSRVRDCLNDDLEDHLHQRKRKSEEEQGNQLFESLHSKRSESMAAVDSLGRHILQSPYQLNNNGSSIHSHHLSHQNIVTSLMNSTPGSSKTFNLRSIAERTSSLDDPYSSLQGMNITAGNNMLCASGLDDGEEVTLDINDIRAMLEEKRKRIERERKLQGEQWSQEVERQSLAHEQEHLNAIHGPASLVHSPSLRSLKPNVNYSNGEEQPHSLVRLREQCLTPQQQQQQGAQQRKSWFVPTDAQDSSVAGQDMTSPSRNKPTYMNIPWDNTSNPSSGRIAPTASPANKFTTVNLSKSASKSVPNVQPMEMSSPQSASCLPVNRQQDHVSEQQPPNPVPQAEGFVIGSELSVPSQENEESMARKKEMMIQQSLKRKAEQEAKRIKQQEEQSRKRDEQIRRAEEQDRKREEEKRRKQQILEEYRMKKAQEEADKRNGGSGHASSTVVLKRNSGVNGRPPSGKARPKSLHVNSSMLQDYASLDAKPSKLSATTPSASNGVSDTVDRSASNSRLFSDGVSSFGGSSSALTAGASSQPHNHHHSHGHVNSTGSSRPTSVLSSSSRLTSPPSSSHPLSQMPSMPPLYQRRGPPSDGGSETGSQFSEYNGPKLYSKPTAKSNRQIILNAINVVLAGTVNADMKKHVLEELNKSEQKHFLILFRGAGLQFRAIYSYCPESDEVTKLHGNGPKNVKNDMIEKFFKYNSGSKNFVTVHTKHLSITIDGFSIHNHLWGVGGRRPASMIKLN